MGVAHYQTDSIECIDALEAQATPEEFRGFCKLTAAAYLWRMGKKGPHLDDAEKALYYVARMVRSLQTQHGSTT